MFRAANGDGAALSWQACQSHPRPLLAGNKCCACLRTPRIIFVRTQTPSIMQSAPSVVIQTPSFPSGSPAKYRKKA